ncbi:MAG: alpha/beta hydrolase family protein [Psychroflexus halocasei]
MKHFLLIIFLCLITKISAQTETLEINQFIEGTFVKIDNNAPLAILIQGSGPTDRNGNGSGLKSDHSKMLYEALNNKGINTFTYDKRSVKMLRGQNLNDTILFDDFVNDQIEVIQYFKDKGYTNIHLIGHSQGSLVAILAAQKEKVASIISLSGTSRTADEIIIEQIEKQMPQLLDQIKDNFKRLQNNSELVGMDNPVISSIFAKQNQKFIVNYMKYDPSEEIEKLNDLPILVINGDRDLQVPVSDAEDLHKSAKNSELLIIEDMNHVLKIVSGQQANMESYNDPEHPVAQKLIDDIEKFIKLHASSN